MSDLLAAVTIWPSLKHSHVCLDMRPKGDFIGSFFLEKKCIVDIDHFYLISFQ